MKRRRKKIRKKIKHPHKKRQQTGKSIKHLDAQRHAKKPGWRRSKSGKRYYEGRRNRSDRGKWL